MVTDRSITPVLTRIRAAVQRFAVPAVTRYARDPFQTLVSCLLSLRTRDAVTLAASQRLFASVRTPQQLAATPAARLEKLIYPVCFYRVKAKTLRRLGQELVDRFGGQVPDDLDALLTLPGVGRKTANLVVTLAFGKPGICVDTHVHRISNRWGYVRTRTPEETEFALRRKLPRRYWLTYNDWLVAYGQRLCHPTSPWCSRCSVARWCARRGVVHSR